MQLVRLVADICAVLVCSSGLPRLFLQAQSRKTTPLILEKDQGERRVWRPLEGVDSKLSLFIPKVEPHNGDREGEKSPPLTKAEDAAILAKHAHAVIYKEP